VKLFLLLSLGASQILWQGLASVRFHNSESKHNDVCLSDKNLYLASGFDGGEIQIWEVRTGILKKKLTTPGVNIHGPDMAFDSKSLHCLAATGSSAIGIWEISSGKLTRTLDRKHDLILAVAMSPDGKYVASGNSDDCCTLWQLDAGKEVTIGGSKSAVLSVAFSPDSKQLAFGSRDGVVRVWDIANQKETHCLDGYPGHVHSIIFGKDSKSIIGVCGLGSGKSSKIVIRKLSDGKTANSFNDSDHPSLSPRADTLATVSRSATEVNVRRLSDSETIFRWETGGDSKILSVSFETETVLVLIGSDRKGLFMFKLQFGMAK
jgi:WD40 repeat protein